MRAVVVEDEVAASDVLLEYLHLYASDVEVLAVAKSQKQAIESINALKPDLVFLDIDLGDGNGFEVIKQIPKVNCHIIFVSGHNELAFKAFRFSALDFLVKPLDPEELQVSLQKYRDKRNLDDFNEKLSFLLGNLSEKKFDKLTIPTQDGFEIVELSQMVKFVADNNYCHLHLKNGRRLTISKTIKFYEELLQSSGFLRVHQSSLINLNEIVRYVNGSGGTVVLSDSSEVEVSRRKKEILMEHFKV